MEGQEYIDVWVDPELKEQVEAQVEDEGTLTGWVREAIEQRLERERTE